MRDTSRLNDPTTSPIAGAIREKAWPMTDDVPAAEQKYMISTEISTELVLSKY